MNSSGIDYHAPFGVSPPPFASSGSNSAPVSQTTPRTVPSNQGWHRFTSPVPHTTHPPYTNEGSPYPPHTSGTPLASSSATWNTGQNPPRQQHQQSKGKSQSKRKVHQPLRPKPFMLRPRSHSQYNFHDGLSAVLSSPTIFTPWHACTRQADWPSPEEMRYEGQDRIATDRLHRRFLCMPRVRGGNDTVGWQKRHFIALCPLDDFSHAIPSSVDVFLRSHYIPDIDPTDAEGVHAVGAELMGLL